MFSARQDEADLKRQKLDYVEITPCLKEVTKTWEEMLNRTGRSGIKFDYEKLLSCVKQGIVAAFSQIFVAITKMCTFIAYLYASIKCPHLYHAFMS